jgi:protein gp37
MKNSAIQWTKDTFNPWWGCSKLSPGCAHCYAEKDSKRYGFSDIWGAKAGRKFMAESTWANPLKWNRAAQATGERTRVFCASMADVFEDREDLIPHRERLFRLIDDTPSLDWLLLTKRPENIARLSPKLGQPNVWLGVSAENQHYWNLRVPILMEIPAVVHFVSAEPLLAPITMNELTLYPEWLIVGGESGPHARPMRAEWARSLRDQALVAGCAFHFKQWGGVNKHVTGRVLDGRTWDELPVVKKGRPGNLSDETPR